MVFILIKGTLNGKFWVQPFTLNILLIPRKYKCQKNHPKNHLGGSTVLLVAPPKVYSS